MPGLGTGSGTGSAAGIEPVTFAAAVDAGAAGAAGAAAECCLSSASWSFVNLAAEFSMRLLDLAQAIVDLGELAAIALGRTIDACF